MNGSCYSRAFFFSSDGKWFTFLSLYAVELQGKGEIWLWLFSLEKRKLRVQGKLSLDLGNCNLKRSEVYEMYKNTLKPGQQEYPWFCTSRYTETYHRTWRREDAHETRVQWINKGNSPYRPKLLYYKILYYFMLEHSTMCVLHIFFALLLFKEYKIHHAISVR